MKKSIRLLTAVLAFVFLSNMAFAQNVNVSGTVTDESGETVPFAYVLIKGTSTGTSADVNGVYSLSAPSNGVLVFSSLGYISQEVAVNGRAKIDVVLRQETTQLDDVMVVAYGTAKKESFTGSAETIKSDKIEKRTVSTVSKALEGMTTGVITTSGSGQPGAGASVVIRGFGSLNASTSPLYVVDGIPYDGALNAINPNDIESMTIIKDASAGALYGARGANGVVIINTKRGQEGGLKVQFKGNWSIASRAVTRYNTMNAYEWTEDLYGMYYREGRDMGYLGNDIAAYAVNQMINGADGIFGVNQQYNPFSRELADLIDASTGKVKDGTTLKWDEDWLDEATAKAPLRQEYLLSLQGGNSKVNYMFSLGYLDQEGLVKGTSFTRYSGRANVDGQAREWLKAGLNVNFANNSTNSTALGSSSGSSNAYSNVFYSCGNMAPIFPVFEKDANGKTIYDESGKPVYDWGNNRPAGANAGWNPIANLKEDRYEGITDNLSGRTYIDLGGLKEGALQGLKLSANFGFDYVNSKSATYYNPDFGDAAHLNGLLDNSAGRTFSYTFNQLLTYNRTFGKHSIDVLLGHEYYDYDYQYLSATKTGLVFKGIYELDGFVTNDDIGGYSDSYTVDSYLSRVNYGYDDKYYFSASYRRDASSRFHKDNRWGNFWSVGASWRISQESFLKDVKWINNITIKASYGVQGNDNIGSLYAWQELYSLAYPNGGQGGALISKLETKDLKWEKNGNMNVGMEARFFNRLSASVEYYRRKTDDMLMSYPLAMSLGFEGYNKNIGSMLNTGVEIALSGDIIKREKFNWNLTLMGSTTSNKVLKLTEDGSPIVGSNTIIKEGEPINSFYLPKSAGVNPANGEKLYWIWDDDPETGERTYEITNSRSQALAHREVCGNRIPDLYGSIANDFRMGNWNVSLLCTYSIGGKILDNVYYGYLYNTYAGETAHKDRAKAWKNPGDVTDIPKVEIGGSSDISYTADDLTNASYFTIKNFSVGYSLPAKWMKSVNLQSVRFTLSGDNLLLVSARKGMNPQYNFSGNTGYAYTPERTVSFGVEINF